MSAAISLVGPGQWIGVIGASMQSDGIATLSIEHDRIGQAFACIQQTDGIPAARADFAYEIKGDKFSAQTFSPPVVYEHQGQRLLKADEHPGRANFAFSERIAIEGKIEATPISGVTISGSWRGSSGLEGTFRLSNGIGVPVQADKTLDWEGFKAYLAAIVQTEKAFLFRGQASNEWALSTSFHRHKRYDLLRYRENECRQVAREFNARLGRRYDLEKGVDFGAVLSMAQHHGFPTPLLDWTKSPYIAAYFALSETVRPVKPGRIFVLDMSAWLELHQPATITDPAPAVSVREFEAHDNPRHIPQQSCHTFSNVADIAGYLRWNGHLRKKNFLTIIDIEPKHRDHAIKDLAFMGLTAASLFPGLDGTCRALKERFFKVH